MQNNPQILRKDGLKLFLAEEPILSNLTSQHWRWIIALKGCNNYSQGNIDHGKESFSPSCNQALLDFHRKQKRHVNYNIFLLFNWKRNVHGKNQEHEIIEHMRRSFKMNQESLFNTLEAILRKYSKASTRCLIDNYLRIKVTYNLPGQVIEGFLKDCNANTSLAAVFTSRTKEERSVNFSCIIIDHPHLLPLTHRLLETVDSCIAIDPAFKQQNNLLTALLLIIYQRGLEERTVPKGSYFFFYMQAWTLPGAFKRRLAFFGAEQRSKYGLQILQGVQYCGSVMLLCVSNRECYCPAACRAAAIVMNLPNQRTSKINKIKIKQFANHIPLVNDDYP